MSKAIPRRIELVVVALIVFGLGTYLKYNFRERRNHYGCQSNLKRIGMGFMQYIRDYDETMMPGDQWMDLVSPYVKEKNLFYCPATFPANGYTMNRYLEEIQLVWISKPESRPLIFDSTGNQPNTADTGQSWPSTPHHYQGNNVVFYDGHVAWLQRKPLFAPIPPRPLLGVLHE